MNMDDRNDLGQAIAREIGRSIAQKIAIGIAIFLAFVVFVIVGGVAVRLLWNWLLPDILSVRPVTFWEALGLLALCRILFGGFGKGGGRHTFSHRKHRRNGGHREWWKPTPPSPPETPGSAPMPGVTPE
jgi:hypothetical protein